MTNDLIGLVLHEVNFFYRCIEKGWFGQPKFSTKIFTFKGEPKAEISKFSNIFYRKPDISKVKFANYFLSFPVFCKKIAIKVRLFAAFSLRAEKLNQFKGCCHV